ncbi:unnamed protein product [Rotaria sp. Silwood2]|nr:unnamed protein product [Rotaria sp. Silwood2]CAF4382990.1 unnamed protein product [Rotaria sp. Silwood2]
MCVSDEDDSNGGEADSKDDSENNSEADEDDSEDNSESDSECDEDNSNDDSESDSSPTLLPSSVSRCPWTVHFHPPPAQQFQSSRKCSGVLPSSPIQTFRRLFSDDVINLIRQQANIYGTQKCQKSENKTNGTDVTKAEIEQFLGINIIMGYCRNPSVANNIRQQFIICNDCSLVLTWTASDGTNVMKKHAPVCSKTKECQPQNQPRITSMFKPTATITPGQLRFLKNKILGGATELCVLDARPFNIINGDGFKEFCQKIYDAGKHCGNMVDFNQLLPHCTTLENDWPVQVEHYIAAVLHPQFKHLDIFIKQIRRHAHELVKNKIQTYPTTSSSSSTTNLSNDTDLFPSLYDKPKDTIKKREFEMYLNSDLRLQEGEDLLKF